MNKPMKLNEIKQLYWKGCVYGPPGVGKSVFACTSQKLRTFVIDVDDGMISVKSFVKKHHLNSELLTIQTVSNVAEYDEAYKWFIANQKDFDFLVIDTITELQRLIISEIRKKSKLEALDLRGWGSVLTITEDIFIRLRYLKLHTLICSHELKKIDVESGIETMKPSFSGRTMFEYAKHLSWIARYMTQIQKVKGEDNKQEQRIIRALDFGPHPNIEYKDRSGMMQRYEKPDIDYILDKMSQSVLTEEV